MFSNDTAVVELDARHEFLRQELAALSTAGRKSRRSTIAARSLELAGYVSRSGAQDMELGDLRAEEAILDELIAADHQTQIDRLAAVRSAANTPGNLERTAPPIERAPTTTAQRAARDAGYSAAAFQGRTPWSDLDTDGVLSRSESPSGLIARAHGVLGIVEGIPGEALERYAAMLNDDTIQPGAGESEAVRAARYAINISRPDYLSAIRTVVRDPINGRHLWSDAERRAFGQVEIMRSAMSLTVANGGYLLPYVLDPTIVLTNSGSANPYRAICTLKQTTSNAWQGVNSAGVNAAWLGEGAAASDNSPTVGQIQITPKKAAAWLFGSYEVLADTDFAQQLPTLLGDAKDRLEEAAFATGAGSSTVPGGTVPAATVDSMTGLVTAANATAVYSLHGSLPARFRHNKAGLAWLSNVSVIDALRGVTPFAAATASIVDNSGPTPRMLGIPYLESTSMDGALTTGGHKTFSSVTSPSSTS